jgi:autoinducer 2 (AI-2) kinase
MENHTKYGEIAEKWQEIYQHQLELVDRGLTEAMWKAPAVLSNYKI